MYVFAYSGAPLKDIVITMNGSRVKQRGVMHKGIDVPFEIDGTLDVTAGVRIPGHVNRGFRSHVNRDSGTM